MNSYPQNDEPSLEPGSPKRGGEPWGRPPNWFVRNLKLLLIGSVVAIAVVITVAVCESVDQQRRQNEITSKRSAAATATAVPTSAPAHSFPVTGLEIQLDLKGASKFRRLLELTPDTSETRKQVWINDLGPMWAFLGEKGNGRPGPEDGSEAVLDTLRAALRSVTGDRVQLLPFPESAPWISGWALEYATAFSFYEHSGVDGRVADLTLKTGRGEQLDGFSTGPEALEVVLGGYNPSVILTKLAACDVCVPAETQELAGVRYMAWGGDLEVDLAGRFKPPWLDHFGRGGRVAIFDGQIARAITTAGIEGLIGARLGWVSTLADNEAFVAAATALEALGAYTAVVSAADFSFGSLEGPLTERTMSRNGYGIGPVSRTVTVNGTPRSNDPSRADAVVSSAPFLEPFEVAAFGTLPRRELDTVEHAVVLVHADEKTAAANADLLLDRLDKTSLTSNETLYADRIRRVEIGRQGRVLIARITADSKPPDYLAPPFLVAFPLTVSK